VAFLFIFIKTISMSTEKNALDRIAKNTSDKVVLKSTELTLSNTAQSVSFSGVNSADVIAIEIRVRKTGVPADATHIARMTTVSGDTPTTSHGMYLGDGDIYTVTGNPNCIALKLIATEALGHIANLVYYGYSQ
jgi:hypothetical protein